MTLVKLVLVEMNSSWQITFRHEDLGIRRTVRSSKGQGSRRRSEGPESKSHSLSRPRPAELQTRTASSGPGRAGRR